MKSSLSLFAGHGANRRSNLSVCDQGFGAVDLTRHDLRQFVVNKDPDFAALARAELDRRRVFAQARSEKHRDRFVSEEIRAARTSQQRRRLAKGVLFSFSIAITAFVLGLAYSQTLL